MSEQLLDFGETEIGASSAPHTLFITNTGEETIDIVDVEKPGPDGDAFRVQVQPVSFRPGATVTVSVTFTAPTFGNHRCVVRLFSQDPQAETYVVLRGIGMNDWWRRAIKGYGDVASQTGHGFEEGDESFYYFLARGNHELGHDEPGLTREQADQIRFNYGWPHVLTDEEIAQNERDAAAFVPPPTLYMDSQGRVGTLEEMQARQFIEDIEAIDNLKTLGGVAMYGVSGLWTDDPRRRMQWAALGNTASFAVGSMAMAYASRMPSDSAPEYPSYEPEGPNVMRVDSAGEPMVPAEPAGPPPVVVSGTLEVVSAPEPVGSEPAGFLAEPEVSEPDVCEVSPTQNATPYVGPERQLGPARTTIGARLSSQSLRDLEQQYGKAVADQTAEAETQTDIDQIGNSLGGLRNQYIGRVAELSSRDERMYRGGLTALSRGTSTTPGTDLFEVTAQGEPVITGVEVKMGASKTPYRQGASSMPDAYRVADQLHQEVMNIIKDRTQPFEVRARMKMALDAGTPIQWEMDAFGNVRFKMRGNDAFPASVVINVPVQVPRK